MFSSFSHSSKEILQASDLFFSFPHFKRDSSTDGQVYNFNQIIKHMTYTATSLKQHWRPYLGLGSYNDLMLLNILWNMPLKTIIHQWVTVHHVIMKFIDLYETTLLSLSWKQTRSRRLADDGESAHASNVESVCSQSVHTHTAAGAWRHVEETINIILRKCVALSQWLQRSQQPQRVLNQPFVFIGWVQNMYNIVQRRFWLREPGLFRRWPRGCSSCSLLFIDPSSIKACVKCREIISSGD